jgi:PAS domain S-box-containing protein
MAVRTSIQAKLRRVILLSSAIVLLLTAAVFVSYDVSSFRRSHKETVASVAQVVANNATSSLSFKDAEDAAGVLNSLRVEKSIRLAILYDNSGKIFAFYPPSADRSSLPKTPGSDRSAYENGKLVIVTKVFEKSRVGTLYVESTLDALYDRLQVYGIVVVVVLATCFFVAYLLSLWMQKRVTTPILELAKVASFVSEKKDFSIRAKKQTEDEIGALTETFNEMLNQIAERDNALLQSSERLRLALEASATGTWDWDLVTGRLIWDIHLKRLFGIKPGEFKKTYEDFLNRIFAEDRAVFESRLKVALDQKHDFVAEFRIRRPDGVVRYMATRGRPLVDDSGKPVRMTGVIIDITESREAAQAMRESEERFRNMADAAPVMIWTSNVSKEYDYFNRSWLEFTNRPAEEEARRGWMQGIHPEDRELFWKTYAASFDARQPFDFQFRLRRHDGEYRWIRDRGTPRFAPDGTFRGYIGSALDVTDIRQNQAELEERVLARTAELAETNRELEAFTYSVSHDLRAPLRHINAYAQILEEDFPGLTEEAKKYIERIRSGAKNMGQLVDDLLNLARVGRQELVVHSISLDELLESVLLEIKPDLDHRDIQWEVEPLGMAECDPGLMKQVFSNVLLNAVKYSRSRAPAIIHVGKIDAPEGTVYYVRDNGVGFNMKYASKLFGVFQRLHRAEDFEGTGVGLATVDRIIRKHGGRIWAEAELDKGATFYFTLARSKPEPKNHEPRGS